MEADLTSGERVFIGIAKSSLHAGRQIRQWGGDYACGGDYAYRAGTNESPRDVSFGIMFVRITAFERFHDYDARQVR